MKYLIPFVLIISLMACKPQSPKEAPPAPKEEIKKLPSEAELLRSGLLDELLLLDGPGLQSIFGDKNLKQEERLIEEGTRKIFQSILYPETEKQINFVFTDSDRRKLEYIYIEGTSGSWSSDEGYTLGLSLLELDSMNMAKEFMFYGFGWDEGGLIEADSRLRIYLQAPEHYTGKELLGDILYSSKLPVAQKVNPTIGRIELHK